MTTRTRLFAAAAAMMVGIGLAACSEPEHDSLTSSNPQGSGSVTPSSPRDDSSPPTFSPSAPSTPGGDKSASATPVVVRGTVALGVEAGCLMLDAGGQQYNLLGGDRSVLRPGRTVEVVGETRSDILTTCQQGTPLIVQQARAV